MQFAPDDAVLIRAGYGFTALDATEAGFIAHHLTRSTPARCVITFHPRSTHCVQ